MEEFNKKNKKNMDLSIFGSDPPTHPPNMDKNKKRHCFLGFLAHLEQKFFFTFFTIFRVRCQTKQLWNMLKLKSPKNNIFFCFYPYLGVGGWVRPKYG